MIYGRYSLFLKEKGILEGPGSYNSGSHKNGTVCCVSKSGFRV